MLMKANIEYLAMMNKGFSGYFVELTKDENLFPKKFGSAAKAHKKTKIP